MGWLLFIYQNLEMKVLYIGNKLSQHNKNITSIETLGSLLEENYEMIYASSKKNQILRLLDMIFVTITNHPKIDIVLIDIYSTLNFYYAFLISQLCRLLQIPYISILRGGSLPLRIKRSPWSSSLIFHNSMFNVAPSGYLGSSMNQLGFKFKVIPNNIQIKDYRFICRKSFSPKLLFVRSFHKLYNPLMAVRVLSLLKKNHPRVELCMIGPDKDGSLNEVLKFAQKLNVEENLILPGFMSKSEWHEKAKSYDIFINTTDHDNTPVSVIEAMALGLPVVSTDAGGVPFLIENNVTGLLVQKNDDKAMADAINKLIKDPSFANELAVNARQKVEGFDWQVVKHEWFNIIDSSIANQQINNNKCDVAE